MKRILLSLLMSTTMLFAFAAPVGVVHADNHETEGTSTSTSESKQQICKGIDPNNPDCDGQGATNDINQLIKTVINVLSFIVGVVAVIMIIIGGFKYIISSGDSGNITSAKNTILYAIIGLVIVAFAQVIVRFVVNTAA